MNLQVQKMKARKRGKRKISAGIERRKSMTDLGIRLNQGIKILEHVVQNIINNVVDILLNLFQ